MHYLNKLKEENAKLYQTIDKIRKEKNDLRSKVTMKLNLVNILRTN